MTLEKENSTDTITISSWDFTGRANPENRITWNDGKTKCSAEEFIRKIFAVPDIKKMDYIDKLICAEQGGVNHSSFWDVHRTGIYKEMGWAYDFRPLMKRYVYRQKHHGWQEGYAPNKKVLRKLIRGITKILSYDQKK